MRWFWHNVLLKHFPISAAENENIPAALHLTSPQEKMSWPKPEIWVIISCFSFSVIFFFQIQRKTDQIDTFCIFIISPTSCLCRGKVLNYNQRVAGCSQRFWRVCLPAEAAAVTHSHSSGLRELFSAENPSRACGKNRQQEGGGSWI